MSLNHSVEVKIQFCYRNHPENQQLKKVENLSEGSLGDKGTLMQHEVSFPMWMATV